MQPATSAAFTAIYQGRTTANWVEFLGQVEGWIDPEIERIYAVMDNVNTHSATNVLLFALAHPRWEFVFQPKYAAYLNLIEPWWKILRSLALKGRRFDAWAEIEHAVRRATDVLERAQAPLRSGSPAQAPHLAPSQHRGSAECHTHLADAPVRRKPTSVHTRPVMTPVRRAAPCGISRPMEFPACRDVRPPGSTSLPPRVA